MPFSRPRAERGAAAVEFALVVPLLLAVVFSIIDLGFAINRYTVLNNATREGVRAASLSASSSEVDAVVNDSLTDLDGKVTVQVTCETPLGGACGSWDGDHTAGGVAVVTATYEHAWLTPMGKALSSSLTLSKTSKMRIE
ncbi:TadE/TadG family type IV pilus assembly protein [Nocardioides ganghwensis]|jgi:Flp pilus assembly protein TadG|uniref:Pilus assembly protein n=1 Tax=Nocardioides ganghwensis TaxID=252230 RepID=A0A4V1RN13_9ACTN|nr:TadE family protein [Nocardioides ganghwensis]MBD3944495.1 pilus assembly protein [Nocardioides ganghwensis]RYC04257.1 pilus assembly protein [Nocardioides ganghwensis]